MTDKEYYTNVLKILKIDLKQVKNQIDKDYLSLIIENTSKRLKELLFKD